MEPNSPRKIQFTVPLLEPHLDPEAAEQIRRRRPTPATLVLSSDQSSPEIDEERSPNPFQKSTLSMSPHQRKKVSRTTPTMKELQLLAEHHLCKQGSEDEGTPQSKSSTENRPNLGCCCHGNTAPIQTSQQTSSCSCFTPDGQMEKNSMGRKQDGQPDSSQGLCGRQTNTDVKETKEKGKQSSHLPIVQDK
ncbi:protein phosphatase 1 regulatory subunit 1A isoform X1 [Hyla sarda]|uniref:protein phosphatase 1 regulatory subunit 1A isoform X1 n=1 Tax=Hyla sarda TaxID=327740 RepID=UPI0024C3F291|nr:protein phosphatase 1 regulatory subunit 1A isoform X1 [Hyla sarda]